MTSRLPKKPINCRANATHRLCLRRKKTSPLQMYSIPRLLPSKKSRKNMKDRWRKRPKNILKLRESYRLNESLSPRKLTGLGRFSHCFTKIWVGSIGSYSKRRKRSSSCFTKKALGREPYLLYDRISKRILCFLVYFDFHLE